MLNNTPIEETFRNAFDNFEADVNPQVWTNIETQITSPAAPASGSAASEVAKTILSAGKFSVLTYGIASSVIIAIVAATYFYLSPEKKVASNLNPVVTSQPQLIENKISAPTESTTAETKHEDNLGSQTHNETKVKNGAAHIGGITPEVVQPATVSNDSKNNEKADPSASHNEQVTTTPVEIQTSADKGSNKPATKDEKQEPVVIKQVENKVQLQEPYQDDDFNWGVIANAMSPNNDGLNDVFAVNTPDLKSIEVTMYDHNGKTVYKWNTLNGSWDGKDFNSREMPAGFYNYFIFAESADGKHHSKKGTLYIFR